MVKFELFFNTIYGYYEKNYLQLVTYKKLLVYYIICFYIFIDIVKKENIFNYTFINIILL